MRLPLVALFVCLVASCFAQPFSDQDRFGKSYTDVALLKHKEWVAWYCDASRAGEGGRVTAEKIYAVALARENEALLATRPEAERKFINDCWIKLANMGKYAFTIGHASYPGWDGWGLATAEVSTNINVVIKDLILARTKTPAVKLSDVRAEFEKGKKRVAALQGSESELKYVRDHYPAMGKMIEQIAKEFETRSPAEKATMWRFCLDMVEVASLERKNPG